MGCQSQVTLENNLTFSITTHDPDTGVLTDAAAAPAYRLYEDETAAPILTGNLAKLDDANTTGFYTELVACTAGNGFETGKSYTIYITATVDGDEGGITYGFTVVDVNAEVLDVLNTDTFAEPGQEAPAATTTLVNKISYIYKFMRNQIWTTATAIDVYNDAADTVDQKSTISHDGTTFKRGELESGP